MRRLAIVCLLASLAPPVAADTVLEFDTTDEAASTVRIVDDAVRIDGAGGAAGEWMLYRAADDALFIVSPRDASYTRLDEQSIAALGGQMDAARAEWAKQMAKLPPEQRAMAEKMMKQMTGGASLDKAPPPEPRPTGSEQTVAGFACADYVVDTGKGTEQLCVAKPDVLDMTADEFDTVRGMYALLAKLSEATGFAGSAAPRADNLPGVPILIQTAGGDRKQRLRSVSHREQAADDFRVPEGYTERDPQSLAR